MICAREIERLVLFCVFFFNDTATTEIYTLSLHDALPIYPAPRCGPDDLHRGGNLAARLRNTQPTKARQPIAPLRRAVGTGGDRKSTRLNSSHANISYAVFCLKKKKNNTTFTQPTNIHHNQ